MKAASGERHPKWRMGYFVWEIHPFYSSESDLTRELVTPLRREIIDWRRPTW